MKDWSEILNANEFPVAWEIILQQRVPIYLSLLEPDRSELRSYIQWFIGAKRFEGCAGLVVTDEIRVTVAAQACLLLLHRDTPCYERLRSIHVYPGTSLAPGSSVSGESWQLGIVVLTWDSVRRGAADPFDGDNLVLHEFAHQLDQEDGQSDGIPLLERGRASAERFGLYTSWARILSAEFEALKRRSKHGRKSVMDSYGSQNPAEFFAVATECFFEKPRQLAKKHAELYAELKQFYRQDPATWHCVPLKNAKQTFRPTKARRRPRTKKVS